MPSKKAGIITGEYDGNGEAREFSKKTVKKWLEKELEEV